MRDAKFTELAADFAAAIRGVPKEDLLSQEVRQQRRAVNLGAARPPRRSSCWRGSPGWQWTVGDDEQRDRAERTLEAATQTANSLVFDLAQQLRDRAGMPADLVRNILDRARKLQSQLARIGRDLSRASPQRGCSSHRPCRHALLARRQQVSSGSGEQGARNPGGTDGHRSRE